MNTWDDGTGIKHMSSHHKSPWQDDIFDGGNTYFTGKSAPTKKCYHSHPDVPLKEGMVLAGGSCIYPPSDRKFDIYVGLDAGMHSHKQAFPWNEGESIRFTITDGQPPKNELEFKKLIDWLKGKLEQGKSVHVGCIGGHGRTGMILACLVKEILGIEDATTYVRKHYCKKVVETSSQISFLEKQWGIKPVKPSKSWGLTPRPGKGNSKGASPINGTKVHKGPWVENMTDDMPGAGQDLKVDHVKAAGSIWGKNAPK